MVTDNQVKEAKNAWAIQKIGEQRERAEENKEERIKKAAQKKKKEAGKFLRKTLGSTVTYRKGTRKIGVKKFRDMLNSPF